VTESLALLAFALLPGLARTFRGEELVGFLYPRRAGCWLLIGPATHKRPCRLPVQRDGLCRWHAAFAAKEMA
jgi:hypothetical protein